MRDYMRQLRCRLLELGYPASRVRRMMGEVSDHRDDLIEAGLAKGLSAEVAQRVAERKLGNPLELAERVVTAHRKSTWFGRHFLLTFGFLPLVAFPLLWALFLALGLWLEIGVGFGWNKQKLHLVNENFPTFRFWAHVAYNTDYAALALAAFIFCWLARRWAVSFTWMTIACLIGSVYAAGTFTNVARHVYTVGYSNHIEWMRALMPVLVVGMWHLNHWRLLWAARRSPVV